MAALLAHAKTARVGLASVSDIRARPLKSMERFGFVELRRGEGGAVQPRVPYEEIKLELPMRQAQRVRTPVPAAV